MTKIRLPSRHQKTAGYSNFGWRTLIEARSSALVSRILTRPSQVIASNFSDRNPPNANRKMPELASFGFTIVHIIQMNIKNENRIILTQGA